MKLLLRYKADPNKSYMGSNVAGKKTIIEPGTTPLMNSISAGIEKTKALVEGGAAGGPNATLEAMEYAYYLIVEKKAKVPEPYYKRTNYDSTDPSEKLFPVSILRDWVCDLDSKEHKIKMEIVEEFTRQGVNYWDTEINIIHSTRLNRFIRIHGKNI